MARLFVTSREIDFFNDISKEIDKDIVGQKVYYYRVREDLSKIHDVYEESLNKVFDPPVEIEVRVDWEPPTIMTDKFGTEKKFKINVVFHQRDLLDRNIQVREGDYISYGEVFYEITTLVTQNLVYGQIEHTIGVKALCVQTRFGHIDFRTLGPSDEIFTDEDAVQREFIQQRGFESNRHGETGDSRDLQKRGTLDKPITGPAEVSKNGGSDRPGGIIDSSFYDES